MVRTVVIALAVVWAAMAATAAGPKPGVHRGTRYVMVQSRSSSAGGPILREWKGLSGGIRTATEQVIRTPGEWTALWRQAHANQVPPPAAPKVDFDREMVIAVFMGERPTGGYSITIENVAFGEKEITVTVREQRPPPDAFTTQALTYPFHMVVVRKSARPVKFVRAAGGAPKGE